MPQIKRATHADLADISQCYSACFPNSIAVALGNKTIRKALEWFLVADNRFLLYLVDDNKVVGFIGGFAPRFIGDGGKSGMATYSISSLVPALLKRPYLLLRKDIVRYIPIFIKYHWGRRIRNNKTHNGTTSLYTQKVLISTIGVHPHYRKQGYGKKLLQEGELYALKYNRKELSLSVKKNNEAAISFYHKAGWNNAGSLRDSIQLDKTLQ